MTAKAMTALPTSNARRLNRAGSAPASSKSSYSLDSGPYSSYSPPSGSSPPASEYASCGSSAFAPANPAVGAIAVASPASCAAGAIPVGIPAVTAGWGVVGASPAAIAAPRAIATLHDLDPQGRPGAQLVSDGGQVSDRAHHIRGGYRERRGAQPVQQHVDGRGGGVHALQRHRGQYRRQRVAGAERHQRRRLSRDNKRDRARQRGTAEDRPQQRLHRLRLGNQPDVGDSGIGQRLAKRFCLWLIR